MANHDGLIGNPKHDNSKSCLAKPDELYLVYLPEGGKTDLDLSGAEGSFSVAWFNPRDAGPLTTATDVEAGSRIQLTAPDAEDWLAVLRSK